MLTQAELKQLFHYDPETGLFIRLTTVSSRANAGDIAGWKNNYGYLQITIHRKQYLAHRLAWLYIHGKFPDHQIDHINHNRSDNRLCNLRAVTHQQNQWNLSNQKSNISGYTGVYFYRNKYRALIGVSNKNITLGAFSTPQEAHQAYLRAKAELHII